MNWTSLPLALVFLACVGCGPADSSPTATATQTSAVPDRPIRNAFPTASVVRLFVETDVGDDGPIFSKPRGLVLSESQRAQFESALLVHTISPDEAFAACFIPHHFFRYFDKEGELIGEIEVCFCCAGIRQSGASNINLKEGQMLSADYGKLDSLIRSLGERTDVQCDDLS